MNDQIIKLFGAYLVLMVVGVVYNKYKRKIEVKEQYNDGEMIQKYLLNESTLMQSKKPIMWVHIEFDKNARSWESFGSRTTENLNQPYQYLTIRSIIEKCGESFNVCIIDDDSFHKIIPDWSIKVNELPRPLRTHMRELAMSKVLYHYGGLLVPSSFACFHNLRPMYDAYIEQTQGSSGVVIAELYTRTSTTSQTLFFPNTRFMGARKRSPVMKQYSEYLEQLISSDYTNELDFSGECGRWFYEKLVNGSNTVVLIPAEEVGVKLMNGKPVLLEDLFGSHDIPISPTAAGIYIPADEILKRTKYQWFARSSPEDVLSCNMVISKYLIGKSMV